MISDWEFGFFGGDRVVRGDEYDGLGFEVF